VKRGETLGQASADITERLFPAHNISVSARPACGHSRFT